MRLLRLSEVHPSPEDRVFRYSPAVVAAWSFGIVCIAAALVLVEWEGRTLSAYYIAYYVSGVLLLSLFLMRRFLLARLRPSNWLARIRNDGLFIQFRSYLNYHLLADDLTVVFIPYQEIRSARLVRERTKIPGHDGISTQTRRLVELELAGDLTRLSKALDIESTRPAPQEKTWYGKSSTLYKHYPVRVVTSPFLQVEWPVAPSVSSFLDALRPYTTIVPPLSWQKTSRTSAT